MKFEDLKIIPNNPTDIKRLFFDSLKRGTGEAYLIAKENPIIDFSYFLIKASLKNYAYDGQCESSRAQYLWDIIAISKKQDEIRKAIFKGLATEQDNTWSLTQLFELVKIYAQQGDSDARQAIYNRFLNHPIEGSDWVGSSEILELDGFDGLVFIAEKFGEFIEKNPDDCQDDWIISQFQKENPSFEVLQELEKVARTNKFVRLYLENIKQTEQSRQGFSDAKQTFNSIVDEVINKQPRLSPLKIRKLDSDKVIQIAKQLLIEKNKTNQERLLRVFAFHKFPFESEFILEKARQNLSSKHKIVENAIMALELLKSKRIRQFALEKIANNKRPELYLGIFASNYKSGDHKLLTELVEKSKNEHVTENLAASYIKIYKVNKTKKCREPLEALYSKMNCGIHRNDIVNLLIENNVLSEKIKSEIKYDSFLDTRQLWDAG